MWDAATLMCHCNDKYFYQRPVSNALWTLNDNFFKFQMSPPALISVFISSWCRLHSEIVERVYDESTCFTVQLFRFDKGGAYPHRTWRISLDFPTPDNGSSSTFCVVRHSKVHDCPHGPLTRYAKLRFAHAPGMPGAFSPPPTSKEIASQRSRHVSRHVRDARAVMHVGIAKLNP